MSEKTPPQVVEEKSKFDPVLAAALGEKHITVEDGAVVVSEGIYFHGLDEPKVKKLKKSIDDVNEHNAVMDPNMAYAIGKANLEVLAADAGFEAVTTAVELYGGRKLTVVSSARGGEGEEKTTSTSMSVRHHDDGRQAAFKDARDALKAFGHDLLNKD